MLVLTPSVLGSTVKFPSLSVCDLKDKMEEEKSSYSQYQKEFSTSTTALAVKHCVLSPGYTSRQTTLFINPMLSYILEMETSNELYKKEKKMKYSHFSQTSGSQTGL